MPDTSAQHLQSFPQMDINIREIPKLSHSQYA